VRVVADDARLPTPLLPNNLSRSSFSIHGPPQPWVAAHAPAYADPPGAIMDWTRLPWFKRFIDDRCDGVALILGSCWYPGSWFDQDAATAVFAKIRDHVERQDGIDHLLLVGDQIYADASYSIFDIREDRERYQESHRHAFRSELAAWVLRHVPTYFAVDDHEFRDGFPRPLRGETVMEFTALADAARLEAWNFQMHHGHWPARSYAARNNALWQEFKSAGYDFFLFDTRSERSLVPPRNGNRLLGDQQIAAFKDWAGRLADLTRPVFIATGSPLAPLPRDEVAHPALALSSDTLRAYPEFVNLLVSTFHDIGFTGRLILLCGDPHYSSMCEATLTAAGQDLGIVCIVSSGVNIPLPFVNDDPGGVDWHGPQQRFDFPLAQGTSVTMRNPVLLSTAMRHVLRIDLAPDDSGYRLDVSVVAADAGAEKKITLRL
jgi:cholesterol oxidase